MLVPPLTKGTSYLFIHEETAGLVSGALDLPGQLNRASLNPKAHPSPDPPRLRSNPNRLPGRNETLESSRALVPRENFFRGLIELAAMAEHRHQSAPRSELRAFGLLVTAPEVLVQDAAQSSLDVWTLEDDVVRPLRQLVPHLPRQIRRRQDHYRKRTIVRLRSNLA